MIDLNNIEEIKKLDPKDVFGSTNMFADQCLQIWKDAHEVAFPNEYKNFQNIVLCGMGGSAYGGYVTIALFKDQLSIPLISVNDYRLPKFVNEQTLVILSSYSGSTEEVLSCANEAVEKQAKITAITSGGALRQFLQSRNLPSIIFSTVYNPSDQPRLGMGYMVVGVLALLSQIGLLVIEEEQFAQAVDQIKKNGEIIQQEAKTIAKNIYGTIPVIFSAEFLQGNAHVLRNQCNETAKSFAAFSPLSELNHHLMEGLKNPPNKKLTILFITSDLYSDVLKKRTVLTQDVVAKNGVAWVAYKAKGENQLTQVLTTLSFGGYLSLFLALLYGQDPSVIPWVDYFKEQLAK
ncbi:MAG: hypothetical protein HY429_01050 [Candidatus Levybacteria bacterium]|nr:hypothetical protein [Candidatus Levybacteria bacterium]